MSPPISALSLSARLASAGDPGRAVLFSNAAAQASRDAIERRDIDSQSPPSGARAYSCGKAGDVALPYGDWLAVGLSIRANAGGCCCSVDRPFGDHRRRERRVDFVANASHELRTRPVSDYSRFPETLARAELKISCALNWFDSRVEAGADLRISGFERLSRSSRPLRRARTRSIG